jgi:hypothetical protein
MIEGRVKRRIFFIIQKKKIINQKEKETDSIFTDIP